MPVSQFSLATLGQVNQLLGFASGGSTARDNFLISQIDRTSREIESFCRKRFVARDYEERYDGSGTDKLFVRNYPILSVATLNDDTDRDFTSAFTIKGKDRLEYPDTGGDGRQGIIRLWNDEGRFASGKQNVLVKYHAGYALVDVEWTSNKLEFRERAAGTIYTIQFPPDEIQVTSLATKLQSAMGSLGLNSYRVEYDTRNRKFTIKTASTTTATLQLIFNSATVTNSPLPPVMGFATGTILSGATSYTPATAVNPHVPKDITQACIDIVTERYNLSPHGDNRQGLKSERIGDYSVSFFGTPVPKYVVETLKRHRRYLLGG